MDHSPHSARPIITGGAWGTELQSRGLPLGASPDGWNVTRPQLIEEIAKAYCEAGSNIVLTNTFQANQLSLERQGLGSEVGRINRLGVVLVRRAVDRQTQVFGSIGPAGEGDPSQRSDAYREQAEALADANADGLVIETMSTLFEAKLALQAALPVGLKSAVTFSVLPQSEADRLSSGEPVGEALQELLDLGAWRVGLNCMEGRQMLPLCDALSRQLETPLWVRPNAGRPIVIDGIPRYGLSPEDFAAQGRDFASAGAAYIGGCCGIGPDHIAALTALL